jgi:protein-disulfide isomerase-like protein with CxxC motif
MSLTVHNKWRHYTEDVNFLEVMQHAHYVTGKHVAPPVTYECPQSVRCGTESQNTKHDLHTATDFDSRLCGSNRILLAGFSVL